MILLNTQLETGVCFITAGPITKLFAWGGRRVEDMDFGLWTFTCVCVFIVEMESLQIVGCLWSIGLIGLDIKLPKIKSYLNRTCALQCPSPVSSSVHLDAPGVPSVAGYVAIPPIALSDPDLR